MTPAQKRQRMLELIDAACAASSTGNAFVIDVVRVAICRVELPALLPDKPTLAQAEASLNQPPSDTGTTAA